MPLLYPLLALPAGRACCGSACAAATPTQQARRPLQLLVPVTWLAVAVVFLLGFRVALNVTRSNVIDVGYAGVIGADRIVDGRALYGAFPNDNQHGDTYGPVVYAAYVPFEQTADVERALGRPARRARRGDRLRPARLPAVLPRSGGACAGRTSGSCSRTPG